MLANSLITTKVAGRKFLPSIQQIPGVDRWVIKKLMAK